MRGISRVSGLSYNTGVSLIRAASQKAQLIHNALVQDVDTDAIAADELWSFVEKNNDNACQKNSLPEIAPIAISLAQLNRLILSGRVGKHTDSLAIELVASTEGKTDCKEWHTDGWSGYERILDVS